MLAKSKVMPSKGEATVPRLELMGAVIAAQLSETLIRELDCRIDQQYFWTDSAIVLGYISNETKRIKVFVANRVREIRTKTNPNDWHHIPGELTHSREKITGICRTILE